MKRWAQGKYSLKNPDKYVGNKNPTYRSSWEFHFMKFCDENPAPNKLLAPPPANEIGLGVLS